MQSNFKASWDLKLTITTGAIVLILGGSLFFEPSVIHSVIILTIIIGCSSLGVYGYSIQNDKLKIIRLGWAKEIKIKDITNVKATPHAMMGSIRRFGIGGLFGYIGNYKNGVLGSYKAYATNQNNTVLIETTNNGKIVVTPDNPGEFVKSINKKLNAEA